MAYTYTFDISWNVPVSTFFEFLVDHDLTLVSAIPHPNGTGWNPTVTVSGPADQIEEIKAILK